MEKIKSFQVDHTKLLPGLYLSRLDTINNTKIYTYDLRLTRPNIEPALDTAVMHTIEHLGATFIRNSILKDKVIYFGPMGCRTGFYLILADCHLLQDSSITPIIQDMFNYIVQYKGQIPGASSKECGNYRDLNLPATKVVAKKYLSLLKNLKSRNTEYTYL